MIKTLFTLLHISISSVYWSVYNYILQAPLFVVWTQGDVGKQGDCYGGAPVDLGGAWEHRITWHRHWLEPGQWLFTTSTGLSSCVVNTVEWPSTVECGTSTSVAVHGCCWRHWTEGYWRWRWDRRHERQRRRRWPSQVHALSWRGLQ